MYVSPPPPATPNFEKEPNFMICVVAMIHTIFCIKLLHPYLHVSIFCKYNLFGNEAQ